VTDRLDLLDYYTLLGVGAKASTEEIRVAFHTFALKFHPDNHEAAAKVERATTIFRRGTEAYRVLRDPLQRKAYDIALARGSLRLRADEELLQKRQRVPPVSKRARPFFLKAQEAFAAGKKGQAKLHLQLALQHQPDHPELLQLKGQLEA
jgi:DnaJ-class molecular chaperone